MADVSDRRLGMPFGPAALSAAAIAIALAYVPALDAPFVEPKLAVLLVAGALGFGQYLLIASVPGSTFGNRNVAAEAVAAALPFGLRLIRFAETPGRSRPHPRPDKLAALGATNPEAKRLAAALATGPR